MGKDKIKKTINITVNSFLFFDKPETSSNGKKRLLRGRFGATRLVCRQIVYFVYQHYSIVGLYAD
jgi:hypothetical protein